MPYVFISYAHEDIDFVDKLANILKGADVETWRDQQLRTGENWRSEIDDKIAECTIFIVVMSSAAKSSEYVTYEWAYALGLRKTVFVLKKEGVALHARIFDLQNLDFTSYQDSNRPWGKLIDDLREKIAALKNELQIPPRSEKNDEGVPATEELLRALMADDIDVIFAASRRLEDIKDPAVVPGLVELLQSDRVWTRRYSLRTLGRIGDPIAATHIAEVLLKDQDFNVRVDAADALGLIRDKSSVDSLIRALSDKTASVRGRSAHSLGLMGDRKAIERLRVTLFDPIGNVRAYAAEALGNLKSEEAVDDIISATLKNDSPWVRANGIEALGDIGSPSAVKALIEILDDDAFWLENKKVSDSAHEALARIGTPEAVNAIKDRPPRR